MGYIIASVVIGLAGGSDTCFSLLCWRWPFIIEVILIAPLSIGIFFIPKDLISVKVIHGNSKRKAEIQLHVKTVLKSSSMSSLVEKKERSRGSFSVVDMTPLQVLKSPNMAPNKSYNGSLLPTHRTPLLLSKSDAGNQLLDADSDILNYNTISSTKDRNNASRGDVGKIETPGLKHSSGSHLNLYSNSTISKDNSVISLTDTHSTAFIDDSNHLIEYQLAQNDSMKSVKCEDFDYDIPLLPEGKFSTEIGAFHESEKAAISDDDGSENETYSEAFLSPEKSVEIRKRRRLRNQVRTINFFAYFVKKNFKKCRCCSNEIFCMWFIILLI